jgi:site-specific DNA-methyltransferase (adenine-specific)
MPEQVLGRIVRFCSDLGDVVLDPFAGSGTTLAVARKLGRRFVGFELSEEYAANVERRLAGIAPGDPLEGSETPHVQPGRRLGAHDADRPPRRRVARANGSVRVD